MNLNNESQDKYPISNEMNNYMANFSTQQADVNYRESPTQVLDPSQMSSQMYALMSQYNSSPPSFPNSTSLVPGLGNKSYFQAILESNADSNVCPPSSQSIRNDRANSFSSHSSAVQEATPDASTATPDVSTVICEAGTNSSVTVTRTNNPCADSEEEVNTPTITTETANEITRTFLSLEEEIEQCVVSDDDWILIIQEKMKVLEKHVNPSVKKNWSGLWDLATKFQL